MLLRVKPKRGEEEPAPREDLPHIVRELAKLGEGVTHGLNREVVKLWQMLSDPESPPFIRESVVETPMVNGIPLVAFDMFERHGRRALGALLSSSRPLRAACSGLEHKEAANLVGRAFFEIESAVLNRELTSHVLDDLHWKAVVAELTAAGARSPEHVAELLNLVQERVGTLNRQRKRAVLGPS
jgi:hypothetical protein